MCTTTIHMGKKPYLGVSCISVPFLIHHIEDTVLPPTRMRISVSNPIPKQPSEMDIVRLKFASKRLEMEQKYKKLQEIAEKSKENARVHKHKARKITKGFSKVKDENENLYIANKKLWEQKKNSRIGRFFGTQQREREAFQRESNHWKAQATKAQTKANYWEKEHSIVSKELSKCRKS